MGGTTVKIPMSNKEGVYALVDEDDAEKILAFGKWYVNDSGYAQKKTRIKGKNVSLRMHILVNNTPKRWHTDHINGNRLDNRKSNLRTTSQQINSWNRTEDKKHSVYLDLPKGVTFDKNRGRFVATRTERRRFDTLKEAVEFAGNKGVSYVRQ